ncbi:hypothetical protein SASPL_131001 [Salvia splendens]|uniref:Transportin-1 n=1 Tax=Salvia splendens TaxID=180675 RepID=A0A8X8ZL62_SALSN|nr:hypothetical protein SASPL_131001 [Salvia splendens]
MPHANQQYIKTELLPCVTAADKQIRSTAGTVISTFVQIGGVAEWPELLHALVKCLDSNDVNHMEGAMDALSKSPDRVEDDLMGFTPDWARRTDENATVEVVFPNAAAAAEADAELTGGYAASDEPNSAAVPSSGSGNVTPNEKDFESIVASTLGICEDVPQVLDSDISALSERPINAFIPRFLQLFQSPHATLRKLALGSVNQYVMLMPTVLHVSMDKYLQGLFLLANDPTPEVRKLVCAAFVQLIEVRSAALEPHLRNVTEYMLVVNKDQDDEVALEACEFWSAYCEAELPPENLQEFLPRLLPILLSNMAYSDDDESIEDGSLPDREQDLKPRFHASRFHGSEDVEDEIITIKKWKLLLKRLVSHNRNSRATLWGAITAYESFMLRVRTMNVDDDIVNVWNLRKCSAAALDFLSNVFGDRILPTLMPIVQAKLSATGDEAWKDREAAVLALGAIGEGCINGLYPHLSEIIAFLVPLLDDKYPLIRSISCWTLSRFSKYIVQGAHREGHDQFEKVLMGLLRRLVDDNKRVQEAACSAFATLEEEAAEELVPRLDIILQHLMWAFGKYQRRNLRIVYDALGTLADAVGGELNQPKYLEMLMPPLITKWQQLSDSDKDLFPLLECFRSIAQALGTGFSQFAQPVYQRCISIIQAQQLAKDLLRVLVLAYRV